MLTKAQKKKLRQKEKKKADAAAKGKGGDGKPKKQTALGKQLKVRGICMSACVRHVCTHVQRMR